MSSKHFDAAVEHLMDRAGADKLPMKVQVELNSMISDALT